MSNHITQEEYDDLKAAFVRLYRAAKEVVLDRDTPNYLRLALNAAPDSVKRSAEELDDSE